MKVFLRYLELTLTAAGVVVVLIVYALYRHMDPWKAAAMCAMVVGVLHGLIFYAVRSTQREARNKAVFSIRGMLDDMVRNRLDVVLYPGEPGDDDWRSAAQRAVWEIQARLNFIESEGVKARAEKCPGSPSESPAV
jgi:predicted membrane channel-forming protein YqfA (hemolysin III family)